MEKIKVIVVPEREEFIKFTSYHNEIYINKNIGSPRLDENNARYVAPLWLDENPQGANRIYHILNTRNEDNCTVLVLGNSFILDKIWNKMGNNRKFEYHLLEEFNFVEITSGLLIPYTF